MDFLNILGTGSAMVTKCYNTCFTLSDGNEHFLVDAGGGNTILANLEKLDIKINSIHNVFISHRHNDHLTGVIWIIRAVAQSIINNKYDSKLKIYAHSEVINSIKIITPELLEKKFTKYIGDRIQLIEVRSGDVITIHKWSVEFFDICSSKQLQFGFRTISEGGKTLTFLGDEPYSEVLKSYAEGVDFLLHEAFCLYSDKDIFKPYEKHHATVKDACMTAEILSVKNLILYHTEDKNLRNRKQLYTDEGKLYFSGNLIVPDDLEVIKL